MKSKQLSLSVRVDVEVPADVDAADVTLDFDYERSHVCHTDGELIADARIVGHETEGPWDLQQGFA